MPACGALCAGIEKISGRRPFYVGKPSPYIMRAALNKMQAHSEDTVIVGDNLRTDILAGFQAGLETILVLSGVSTLSDIDAMPFRPDWIFLPWPISISSKRSAYDALPPQAVYPLRCPSLLA